MIKNICLVRLSALGDVLMFVPLVRTLQTYLPQTKLTWIISRPAYDLVQNMEGIEFIVIQKPVFPLDYWRFNKLMQKRQFDILFAAQANFRANLLYPFIRAKRKIGYDKLRAKDGHGFFIHESIEPGSEHTLEGFIKFAKKIGVLQSEIVWNLPLDPNAMNWVEKNVGLKKNLRILINPAASKPERSWSIKGYIEVVRYLQQRYLADVILTGGSQKHELKLGEEIGKEVNVLNLIGKTKLPQLLTLIQTADLMICPDTGPSHMSCAVGTPVIALHAVTSAKVSGPYLFKDLAIDEYEQVVTQKFGRTPIAWGTHMHGKCTMDVIKIPKVLEKIDQILKSHHLVIERATPSH